MAMAVAKSTIEVLDAETLRMIVDFIGKLSDMYEIKLLWNSTKKVITGVLVNGVDGGSVGQDGANASGSKTDFLEVFGRVVATGLMALAGYYLTSQYTDDKYKKLIGAGVGGVAGLTASCMVSFRDIYEYMKEKLTPLTIEVWKYLCALYPDNIALAIKACAGSKEHGLKLACMIVNNLKELVVAA